MSDIITRRGRLDKALAVHGPELWDKSDRGIYADELFATYGSGTHDMDAEGFAHSLWTMGATAVHEGHCRYRDEYDAHDGDGSNGCAACGRELTELAHKVLADLASTDQKVPNE